jgi:hypothetical protein
MTAHGVENLKRCLGGVKFPFVTRPSIEAADDKMRRMSEPRNERDEFRRIQPQLRRAGEPEGLVTRAPSFAYFSLRV